MNTFHYYFSCFGFQVALYLSMQKHGLLITITGLENIKTFHGNTEYLVGWFDWYKFAYSNGQPIWRHDVADCFSLMENFITLSSLV